MSNNITFVIFTFNEEARIENVILNLKNYGQVLLADDGSNDETHNIALKHNCKILIRPKLDHLYFAENQQMVDFIFDNVETDWIYWGFADEMLEFKTINEIIKIISTKNYDIINIDRKNYFFGKFCHNMYHARTNKIFKKGSIDFSDNEIHGMGSPVVEKNRIYYLDDKYFVHHFISNTINSYLNIINIYTELELKNKKVNSNNYLQFILSALGMFIKQFIINGGYKAGFAGLALGQLTLFYSITNKLKIYEYNNNINRNTIEEANNVIRSKILKDF